MNASGQLLCEHLVRKRGQVTALATTVHEVGYNVVYEISCMCHLNMKGRSSQESVNTIMLYCFFCGWLPVTRTKKHSSELCNTMQIKINGY